MKSRRIQSKQKVVEGWVHSFGNELYSWAYHKTNDRNIAEDLVQETFLAAYKGRATIELLLSGIQQERRISQNGFQDLTSKWIS